jgi:hypothetical protein
MPPEIVTWLSFWEEAALTMNKKLIAVNNFVIFYVDKGKGFLSNPLRKIVFNADLL